MEQIKKIWEFICACWPSLVGFIQGGTVATVIAIICGVTHYSMPSWMVWSLIALACFASAFRAYHNRPKVVEVKKVDFHWPLTFLSFCIFVLTVWFFTQPKTIKGELSSRFVDQNLNSLGTINGGSLVLFNMEIYNSGRPTIVENWLLIIRNPKTKEIIRGVNNRDLNQIFLDNKFPNFRNGYIFENARNNPIPSGGMVNGVMEFTFPATNMLWLKDSGTIYEISFADVYGNYFTNSFQWPQEAP